MIEAATALLIEIIKLLGPAIVRKHVDEYEAARIPGNAVFRERFGEDP